MPAATLSAARDTKRRPGEIVRYLMTASKTIYKGALVSLGSGTGLAKPLEDASGEVFVGIARETVTSAASGSYYITVEKKGIFDLVWWDDDVVAQADVGAEVYGASDSDVTILVHPNGTNHSNNSIKVGTVVGFVGAVPQVRIDNYAK